MARSRAPRIIGRIFKTFGVLLVLCVTCILGWRVCASEDYEITHGLSVNEPLKDAYAEHGEDLILQYQKQPSITKAEKNYGYFSVVECVFIPQANQVQLVVRYNNSTLEHLKADYELDEIPDREEDHYDVTLVLTEDIAPGSNNEKAPEHRIHATGEPIRENTRLYTYRRYTFDNVKLTDDTAGVFVDIYYNGDVNYEAEAYGTLLVYDRDSEWIAYKPSKSEWDLLEE